MADLELAVDVGEPVELPPLDGSPDAPPVDDGPDAGGASGEPEGDADAAPFPPEWAVEIAVKAVFNYAASKRGEHWELTPEEAHEIAEPLAIELALLAERWGVSSVPGMGFLDENKMRLITALANAIVPRYVRDVQLARERDAAPVAKPEGEPEANHHAWSSDEQTGQSFADRLAARSNGEA